jgi:hypothetical protein
MSQYQSRDSGQEHEEIAELEWLEDGVNIIAAHGLHCATRLFYGVFRLLSSLGQDD